MQHGIKEEDKVTLQSLKDGAILEVANHTLAQIFENIADVNTNPKATRELTIKLKIKPDEDRTFGHVEFGVAAKLAPVAPVMSKIFFAKDRGQHCAVEHDPKQERFNFNSSAPVTPLSTVK